MVDFSSFYSYILDVDSKTHYFRFLLMMCDTGFISTTADFRSVVFLTVQVQLFY